jgi:hypothetical protein
LGFASGDRQPIGVVKPYSIVIMQFWKLFCASLLILSMASCKKEAAPTAPTASTPPTAPTTPTAPTAPTTPTASTDPNAPLEIDVPAPKSGTIGGAEKSTNLNDFQIKLASIEKAIAAGKLAEAKTEFIAVETAWKQMENGELSKSPDRYKAIIASEIKLLATGIDTKKDKDTLLVSLKKISENIDILRK